MPWPMHTNHSGFTLLEIILVLVLMSIFATIAVSRQPSTNVVLKSQTNSLRSHIRYAQMRAINSDNSWGIAIDAENADGYWLFEKIDAATSLQRLFPSEEAIKVNLGVKNISISLSSDTNYFLFDEWGHPEIDGNDIDTDLIVTLQKTDESSTAPVTLAITPETGYVR